MSHRNNGLTAAAAAALREMDAENRAVKHLVQRPHLLGTVAAVKTALDLAAVWSKEAREMLARNDLRPVYQSTEEERSWLRLAYIKYRQTPLWAELSDTNYSNIFTTLPPDAAAYVAYKVARYALRGEA